MADPDLVHHRLVSNERAFDFLVSALGLIVLLPVMLVIAYFVSRSSPGGVLFVQTRVGKSEKLFQCYKFRTMVHGAPVAGSHEVDESWITPTGRRLRSAKLDELPQLFNVLRGDMSLVGPRPCLPNQIEVIAARRAPVPSSSPRIPCPTINTS